MLSLPKKHVLALRVTIAAAVSIYLSSLLDLPIHWSVISVISNSYTYERGWLLSTKDSITNTFLGCMVGATMSYILDYVLMLTPFYKGCLIVFMSLVSLYFTITDYFTSIIFTSTYIILLSPTSFDNVIWTRVMTILLGSLSFYVISLIVRDDSLKKEITEDIDKIYALHKKLRFYFTHDATKFANSRLEIDILDHKTSFLIAKLVENSGEISSEKVYFIKDMLFYVEEIILFYNVYSSSNIRYENNKLALQKVNLFSILISKSYEIIKNVE